MLNSDLTDKYIASVKRLEILNSHCHIDQHVASVGFVAGLVDMKWLYLGGGYEIDALWYPVSFVSFKVNSNMYYMLEIESIDKLLAWKRLR